MKQIVYLAGGMRTDWQDRIKKELSKKFTFLDPRVPNNKFFEEFTVWDLWAIQQSDIVFVYAEKTNPGTGYIAEAGYAKGLGKIVILVREDNNDHFADKYLAFTDCMADYKTNDLGNGIHFLSKFSE